MHPTKQKLLEAGMAMLLERGYGELGIRRLLDVTGVPRGSFYHHFEGKEHFALQVVDLYMAEIHKQLDQTLNDRSRAPLDRVRRFFELTAEKYRDEGHLGCLLGALGQELSGVNEVFRLKIKSCLGAIAARIAVCLEEARQASDLPGSADPELMADVLVDCWEGAALRVRLDKSVAPLESVLDFYFGTLTARQAS